jgi:transposase
MGPYSTDFRLKVVRAYERGEGSQRHLARVFGVSVSFVQDLLQRYRRTGSGRPQPHGGGNPGKIGPHLAAVARVHSQQPDASLAERCERLAAEVAVQVSRTTMSRALRRLQLTRKKRHSMPLSKTRRRGSRPVPHTGKSSGRPRLRS